MIQITRCPLGALQLAPRAPFGATEQLDESPPTTRALLQNVRSTRNINGNPGALRERGVVSSLQSMAATTLGRALAAAQYSDLRTLQIVTSELPYGVRPFAHGALSVPAASTDKAADEVRLALARAFVGESINVRSVSAALNIRRSETRVFEMRCAHTFGLERVRNGESCLDVSRGLGFRSKAKYALQMSALHEFGWKDVLAGRPYADVARELGVDGGALEKLKLMIAETFGRAAILDGAGHEMVARNYRFEQCSNAWKRLREISLNPTSDRYALQKELRKEFAIGDA